MDQAQLREVLVEMTPTALNALKDTLGFGSVEQKLIAADKLLKWRYEFDKLYTEQQIGDLERKLMNRRG